MRIIIAGSRDFNNYDLLVSEMYRVLVDLRFKGYNVIDSAIEVISGTARGADRLGEQFAKRFKLKLKRFPADWDRYGKRAGYLRNHEMAKYAKEDNELAVLIAFTNGSKGTGHMIDIANKEGLLVYTVAF